jgi:uncharacterized phage protein (TIGR02220 family)
MRGWIKLHRSLQKWGWKKSPYHTAVFIDLLLEANHTDCEYMGVVVPKGSLTTSIKAISQRSGVTEKRVRTVLTHLKQSNEVTIKTTTKFSLISITKWGDYQEEGEARGEQWANEGQTRGKRGATNKNVKNDNNEKNNVAPPVFEDEPQQLDQGKKVQELPLKILTAFNTICFSRFMPVKSNIQLINARLKEGYLYEDFIEVIKFKQKCWENNPDMRQYIQPKTLFCAKHFDGYLQAAKNANKPLIDPLDAFFEQYAPKNQAEVV